MTRVHWTLLSILLCMLLWHDNPGSDYWYHLFLGESVWRTGSLEPADRLLRDMPGYFNVYWFYQAVQSALYAGLGQYGSYLLYVALGATAAWFWIETLKVNGAALHRVTLVFAALLSLLVWNQRFEWRPEMVSYAALSIVVYVVAKTCACKTASRQSLVLVGVTQWIWTNSHGYFVLGPVLLALALVGAVMLRDKDLVRAHVVLLATAIVASLAGPMHVKPWANAWHMRSFLEAMTTRIQEFMPPSHGIYLRVWTVVVFWILWVGTLVSVAFAAFRKRQWVAALLAAFGLYLSASYYRNIPLLALMSAPLWAGGPLKLFAALEETLAPKTLKTLQLAMILLCAMLGTTILSGHYYKSKFSSTRFGLSVSNEHAPVRFVDFINGSSFRGKIFNSSSDGGYLELHAPQLRPYGDSRFSDVDATSTYFNAIADEPAFRFLNEKHQFDGVLLLLLENQVLVYKLMQSADWTLAYSDLHRAFFVSQNTAAGASFAARRLDFYEGEDVEVGDNLPKTLQWAKFLAARQRFDLLETALDEYLNLATIHPGVMAIALRYYEAKGDIARIARLKDERARVADIPGKDRDFVMGY